MGKATKNLNEVGNFSWQLVKSIGGFLLALIIIRFYVFQPFTISGASMEPSFFDKEYLIVNELTYQFSAPKRGDVVIFRHPEPSCNDHVESNYINRVFFQGTCSNYIKRVIGLPGETVSIKDGKIVVVDAENNAQTLSEDYILSNIPTLGNQTVTLNKDEYFVLGDNRNPNASSDSREWGVLPRTHIVGKAMAVLLPPNRFGFVPKISY
jgi:signal peptidase I